MTLTTIAAVASVLLPVSPLPSSGTLSWQLIGTDPDIYAPSAHQPSPSNYFSVRELSAPTFLRPHIGMSFAALRASEQCDHDARVGDIGDPSAGAPSSNCS